MGERKKCSFFSSPEIISMARDSATVTSTAPVSLAKEMLSLVRDLILKDLHF
jgi:hypothetical protein